MTGEEITDDWWNSIPQPARWLIVGALLSSVASGGVNWNKDTSDRFKGADFRREIATRDAEILALRRQLHSHLEHSAKYTQLIIEVEKDVTYGIVQTESFSA